MLLKSYAEMPLYAVYNCFACFIHRFLPTFFNDEEFLSLQCELIILKLLLRYHDPELGLYLEKNHMTPELYATPWILTFFAK